jgi:hypothetical protein
MAFLYCTSHTFQSSGEYFLYVFKRSGTSSQVKLKKLVQCPDASFEQKQLASQLSSQAKKS